MSTSNKRQNFSAFESAAGLNGSELKPENFTGFLGDLFDSMPQGVMLLTQDRELIYINQKMRELWGLSDDIKTGPEVIDAITNQIDNLESHLNRVSQKLTDTESESKENIKLKNGKVYLRISKPILIGGEFFGRSWTFRDITIEYLAQQSLLENELKYKELYDHAERTNKQLSLIDRIRTSAFQTADQTHLIKNLVNGLSEIFGYTLVQFYLHQEDYMELVHSVGFEDGDVFQKLSLDQGIIGRTARNQTPTFVEDINKDPDFIGSISNVISELSVPIFDRNKLFGVLNVESKFNKLTENDLTFITGLCEQVSGIISRVRLHIDVLTQEKQLQRIFDFAPIGVVICALDGTFLESNQAFEKLIGYQIGELRQMKFKDITHPDEVDNNLKWTARLVAGEIKTYGFEKRYIHKNGDFINVFLQVSILPTPISEPNQLIAQIVDVTPLKQAETALMQHQKLESIGVLAGGIAHDFNNLLVAIKAQSSLALLKLTENSLAQPHIEKAINAADSAAQLTSQLLTYSGQGKFKIEQCDLNLEIKQNTQLLKVAIPKNVTIQNHLEQNIPQVRVDNAQLKQILMNLIINGAEAMNGKQGEIVISTKKAYLSLEKIDELDFMLMPPAPGPFVEISIKDNGQGMEEETMRKIFDPFFTTKLTGRGLGLAAVLGIVRSHNGGLVVNSRPKHGTTFRIFFPVAANQTVQLKSSLDNSVPPSPAELDKERKLEQKSMVLLIDDDEMVRETMVDLFQLEDISIICAANGSAGIDLLKEYVDQISVVLLDLSMPGISSEETFTELRKLNAKLPILLCSGYSQQKVNEFFAQNDHSGFIAKPFDIEDLIKKVREFL